MTKILTSLHNQKTPIRITLIYLILGTLWILFSDLLLTLLSNSNSTLILLQSIKGWFYVSGTAALLYILIKRDMSLLQRSQETLRMSEERYRLLFELANDAIFITDKTGKHIEVNRQAEALTGYSRTELLAMCFTDLSSELEISPFQKIFQNLGQIGNQTGQTQLRHQAGYQLEVEYAVAPGPPFTFQIILREITERKRAELELRRQALIFKHLTDGIIITNLKSQIIDWNPAAETIFGYTKTEVIGQPVAILYQPEEAAQMREAIVAGINQSGYWTGQLNYSRKDGRPGVCETTIVTLPGEAGLPVARVGINRDITERLRLETQLQQAQKMEAVGRLAGGIAHDFNNLLTVIIGYTELLETFHLDPASPAYGDLQQIRQASQRAADLTRRLLAFSRQQVLQPKLLDLNSVIVDLEKMFRRLIGENIELMTILEKNLHPIKVDPTQLEQIVMNLVVNARDAMPRGGRLTIETANVRLDETYTHQNIEIEPGLYVMLAITDTGHGIEPYLQSKIFEPFFTTKEQDHGTGLGLAMVHGIVEQSGAYLKLYSKPGWGATFKIYFPQAEKTHEPGVSQPATSTSWQGTETVLLVEDETGVRDLIREVLTEYGYTVLPVPDGNKAVQDCLEYSEPIHLLLTDMVLPDTNGLTLAEKLSKLRPQLKIIYMSGYTDQALALSNVLKPDHLFLQKPFTPTSLVRRVREVLDWQ